MRRARGRLPSWRWRRRWPAASAPASAARCRSPAAATCASASTGRWSRGDEIETALVAGSGTLSRARRRALRDRARAPGHQRLGDLRRDRRPARLRRRSCVERFPFTRLRLEDDHPGAAGRQPAAAALRDARRDDQLDRAARTRASRGSSPHDLPQLARAAGAADRLGDGDQPRGVRAAGRAGRRRATRWRRSSSTSPARTSSRG